MNTREVFGREIKMSRAERELFGREIMIKDSKSELLDSESAFLRRLVMLEPTIYIRSSIQKFYSSRLTVESVLKDEDITYDIINKMIYDYTDNISSYNTDISLAIDPYQKLFDGHCFLEIYIIDEMREALKMFNQNYLNDIPHNKYLDSLPLKRDKLDEGVSKVYQLALNEISCRVEDALYKTINSKQLVSRWNGKVVYAISNKFSSEIFKKVLKIIKNTEYLKMFNLGIRLYKLESANMLGNAMVKLGQGNSKEIVNYSDIELVSLNNNVNNMKTEDSDLIFEIYNTSYKLDRLPEFIWNPNLI